MIHLSTGIVIVAGSPRSLRREPARLLGALPGGQLIRPDRSNCASPPPGVGCTACVKDKPALVEPLASSRPAGSASLPNCGGRARVRRCRCRRTRSGWRKSREDAASLAPARGVDARGAAARRTSMRRAVDDPQDGRMRRARAPARASSRCAAYGHGPRAGSTDGTRRSASTRASGEPLRVGFVGSLVWYKGLSRLARARRRGASAPGRGARPRARRHDVGGSDPVAASAVREVSSLVRRGSSGGGRSRQRITFHGRFAHDDLARIHAELDVLVVPSLWQEAYGLTVREAFSSRRTPVIGSDDRGDRRGHPNTT